MNSFGLLTTRRFLPLFIAQFLGAFNGNLFKNATIVLILFRLGTGEAAGGKVTATLALALFVLPFFLFSATAGQLADRFAKNRITRWTKAFELGVAAFSVVALESGTSWMPLLVLFLLGTQAAAFGPSKYGILPELLPETELLAANGMVEAGTFVAILLGTLSGSLLILHDGGIVFVETAMVVSAIAGFAVSLAIPPTRPGAPGLAIDANLLRQSLKLVGEIGKQPGIMPLVMGISWFWLAGATYLTQFPALAKDLLQAGPPVVSLFLVMFTLGISLGSLACQRLLKGRASLRFVPWGCIGMTLFGLDFIFAAQSLGPAGEMAGVADFLAHGWAWRMLIDLLATAMAAGLYVVPIYTLLQERAHPDHRARIVAANNVMNSLFMTLAAGIAAVLLMSGLGIRGLLAGMALLNLPVAWAIRRA